MSNIEPGSRERDELGASFAVWEIPSSMPRLSQQPMESLKWGMFRRPRKS